MKFEEKEHDDGTYWKIVHPTLGWFATLESITDIDGKKTWVFTPDPGWPEDAQPSLKIEEFREIYAAFELLERMGRL